MAESEMIVGELTSFGCGSLRLRDGDILVVQSNKLMSDIATIKMRETFESELKRLGIDAPKVLTVPAEVSLNIIERN